METPSYTAKLKILNVADNQKQGVTELTRQLIPHVGRVVETLPLFLAMTSDQTAVKKLLTFVSLSYYALVCSTSELTVFLLVSGCTLQRSITSDWFWSIRSRPRRTHLPSRSIPTMLDVHSCECGATSFRKSSSATRYFKCTSESTATCSSESSLAKGRSVFDDGSEEQSSS